MCDTMARIIKFCCEDLNPHSFEHFDLTNMELVYRLAQVMTDAGLKAQTKSKYMYVQALA